MRFLEMELEIMNLSFLNDGGCKPLRCCKRSRPTSTLHSGVKIFIKLGFEF